MACPQVMDTLPLEIVRIITKEDIVAILLGRASKRYYSLLPSVKEHLTYPEYIHALETGDFMSVYRSKDGYCWGMETRYTNEYLVKYLQYNSRRAFYVDTHPYMGVLHPACVDTPGYTTDDSYCWMLYEGYKIPDGFLYWWDTPKAIYHSIRLGLDVSRIDIDHGYQIMYMYGYGLFSITDVLNTNDSLAIGLISHDYPEQVLDRIAQENASFRASVLFNAVNTRSRMILRYIEMGNDISYGVKLQMVRDWKRIYSLIDFKNNKYACSWFRAACETGGVEFCKHVISSVPQEKHSG